ncbi:MAG: tetratricopeptide repeat protein [Proteobacteria bacterium]|nr:tetratricopeptide repeat protein [Pseudomonadota bacterium]
MKRALQRSCLAILLALASAGAAMASATDDAYRAEAAQERGELDLAIQLYTQAIQSGELASELLPGVLNNRGLVFRAAGRLDEAIQDYGRAIDLKPDDASAYNNRGIAYSDKGEIERAIRDYDAAIERDPNFADAHNNRGVAFSTLQRFTRAIQDFARAIYLNPSAAAAYANRADAFRQMGETTRALQDYDQAIRLQPDDAAAYLGRAMAYLDNGQRAQALQDLGEAFRRQPDLASAYLGSGETKPGAPRTAENAANLAAEARPPAGEAAAAPSVPAAGQPVIFDTYYGPGVQPYVPYYGSYSSAAPFCDYCIVPYPPPPYVITELVYPSFFLVPHRRLLPHHRFRRIETFVILRRSPAIQHRVVVPFQPHVQPHFVARPWQRPIAQRPPVPLAAPAAVAPAAMPRLQQSSASLPAATLQAPSPRHGAATGVAIAPHPAPSILPQHGSRSSAAPTMPAAPASTPPSVTLHRGATPVATHHAFTPPANSPTPPRPASVAPTAQPVHNPSPSLPAAIANQSAPQVARSTSSSLPQQQSASVPPQQQSAKHHQRKNDPADATPTPHSTGSSSPPPPTTDRRFRR